MTATATQPIARDGAWWQQGPEGGWFRWNEVTQAWDQQATTPPAPPPPPAIVQYSVAQFTPTVTEYSSTTNGFPVYEAQPTATQPITAEAFGTPANSQTVLPKESRIDLRRLAPVVAIVVALALVATFVVPKLLGGGDDAEPTARLLPPQAQTTDHSKAEAAFIKRANKMCGGLNRRFEKLGLRPTNQQEAIAYLDAFIPEARKAVAQMGTLKPPKSMAKDMARLMTMQRKSLALVEQLRPALANLDAATLQKLEPQGERLSLKSKILAESMGLDVCTEETE